MTHEQAARFFYLHGNIGWTRYTTLLLCPKADELKSACRYVLSRRVDPSLVEEAREAIQQEIVA